MALAQVIQGTSEEIIHYLKNHQGKHSLTLINPEFEEESLQKLSTSYPEGATVRNGFPLLPTEGRTEMITLEKVKRLLEDDD